MVTIKILTTVVVVIEIPANPEMATGGTATVVTETTAIVETAITTATTTTRTAELRGWVIAQTREGLMRKHSKAAAIRGPRTALGIAVMVVINRMRVTNQTPNLQILLLTMDP